MFPGGKSLRPDMSALRRSCRGDAAAHGGSINGLSTVTGLGVADDLQSLMVYTTTQVVIPEPSAVIVKLPLCEHL